MKRSTRVIAVLVLALGAISGLPSNSSAETLYDQTTGLPGGFLTGAVADDFTIPPGPPWFVQSVHVDGQGGAGSKFEWGVELADPLPATSFPSDPAALGSSNQVSTPLPGTDAFDIPVDSQHPLVGVALAPGHYWLSVYARSFASPTKAAGQPWAWQTQSPLGGYEAILLEKACYGSTPAWKALSACGKVGPDLRFRINGERMDSTLSSVKLVEQFRRPAGGVTLVVKVPVLGTLAARKVSGKGQVTVKTSQLFENDDGYYLAGVKVKPKGATKAALKQGAKLTTKVAISYTPKAYNGVEGVAATKIFKVLLKKVRE